MKHEYLMMNARKNIEKERRFRTMDGSCNNLEETNFGRAGTPLQRILDPSYGGNMGKTQILACDALEIKFFRPTDQFS